MKRLQVLFLVALSSSLLLFGCGKGEETSSPVVDPEDTEPPPAEGMVRSRLTNE